ncbi:Prkr-interacting protein [Thalictrum thalictroides]|uniref:Prkr-interacting protein n=1 Tax=Thalictrum thalictroides TaxID=46969 RepID=A0A7J6WKU0_THATH|nr:Prkr-interacting protein [Thalictrum thalictroides]
MSFSANSKSVMEGDLQLVSIPKPSATTSSLPPLPISKATTTTSNNNAIVEYTKPVSQEDEDLEVKLRRIIDNVPVRVNNTSGSSAGSGSGDFHQYRQMRRKEQDRLMRMDAHYEKTKEVEEFNLRREERLKAAEERTAKKRAKRQKKRMKKKEKVCKVSSNSSSGGGDGCGDEEQKKDGTSDDEDDKDSDEEEFK